jgi:hypothetical protein
MVKKQIKVLETKKLNVKYKGSQIVAEKYKGKFTREDIKKHVQSKSDLSKTALGFDGRISVALYYPSRGWRSGYFTSFGAPIAMYNIDSYDDEGPEDDSFTDFQIYYLKDAPKKGGCSGKRNDCLFNCLKSVVQNMPWKYPASMKKYLNVERDDKIHIDLVREVEHKLGTYKINVTGDHTYTSTKDCQRVIDLELTDGHYKIVTNNSVKLWGVAHNEKIPLICKKVDGEGMHEVYDIHEGLRKMSSKDVSNHKSLPKSSKYTIVPAQDGSLLKDQCSEFHRVADNLKEKTKGLINLYKTGTYVKTALHLFNHFNQTITAEPIGQVEGDWLQKAHFAALIFADKYEGPAYKYDVCSHYPALMSHRLMYFPIKAGIFHNITTEQIYETERVPFGIYRCIIQQTNSPDDARKLFRWNKFNYYTHIDIHLAKELKLNITMVEDDQPNQLEYNRSDLVTGSQLFKPFYDYVFKLKKDKVEKAKDIITKLWGALTQKNVFTQIVNEDSEDIFEIKNERSLMKILPRNDKQIQVEYYKNDCLYETNFARIGPFVTARGRQLIGKFMKDNIDQVVRCHTDGFLSKIKLNIKTGIEMGDVKYEGYCDKVKVNNNISVVGEFIL